MPGSQHPTKPPSLPSDLDLEIYTEATRRALYDIVVAVHFTTPPEVARGDWFPIYTPDQAGLAVHFTAGRWLACWTRLEEAESDLPVAAASRSSASRPRPRRPMGYRSMKSDGATSGQKGATLAPPERQPQTLTDGELLGLVLAGGRVFRSSSRLARELLGEWGGLAALPGTSRAMLRHRGLSQAQAAALLAACELACRLARRRIPPRRPLSRPDLVAHFLALRYRQRDQEVMGALFLDRHHGLLGETEIFRGTLHRVAVEPRQILRQCLLRGAAGVVVFHTHPGGGPIPCLENLAFTRRLAAAAAIVGVDLVDHLVLGAAGHWVSVRARGGW